MNARTLPILLLLVPVLELWLLVQLGGLVGFWPTVLFVIGSAVAGVAVARREGLRVLRSYQQTIALGRVPEEGLLSALLVLVGGLLLIFPGVLTDVAGILLFVPPTRRSIAERIRRHLHLTHPDPRTGFVVVEPAAASAGPSAESWERVPRRGATHAADLTDAELVDE